MVGALMYLTASRPDIVHATCYCACYQAKPTEKHLTAVKWIFRYLKNTIHLGLWYPKDTGGDKLVSWSSKKQDCTLMSSAEAESVSLSACCTQVLWLRTQLTDYGFHFDKIPMYCYSKASIAISCNPVQHSRTKHIDVRYHFIKEQVEKRIAELFFVRTEYQLADLFTKAVSKDRSYALSWKPCQGDSLNLPDHRSHIAVIHGGGALKLPKRQIRQSKRGHKRRSLTRVSALKLLVLKTGDYDLWSMRLEQYLNHTDYALWEVIVNGDAPAIASASAGTKGVIPPKTAKQKLAKKNELKTKSTLLLAIPDEHLLKFHGIKDAKTLWEAIKARSEGLDKTYDRFQKLINQLEIHGEVISQEDANLKLLRSLPSA
ncbi:hypothetical protein Tco_0733648 [Tanacetum coccineum]